MISQKFEMEKAVQAINYIIQTLELKHIDKLDALKLVFLADRYHLRKYGRPITNDEYWAMTYGPVASSVKDIVEIGDYLSSHEKDYTQKYLQKAFTHQVKSVEEVDLDVFSETDIEALNAAIAQKKKHQDLVEFTHLFPEWQMHEATISGLKSRVKMNLIHCFNKAPVSAEYCVVDDEVLELNKEHFCDQLEFDNAW